jgi:hypothetical protein
LVDSQSKTVSLRSVEVGRYDQAAVVISHGLKTGDVVVTAGVQTLRSGQKVRFLERRDEPLQPDRMGDQASLSCDLFHARCRDRRRLPI